MTGEGLMVQAGVFGGEILIRGSREGFEWEWVKCISSVLSVSMSKPNVMSWWVMVLKVQVSLSTLPSSE